MKDKRIVIAISQEELDKFDIIAKKEERTRSSLIRIMINRYISQNGSS